MSGLFDKQSAEYVTSRPRYPKEWFTWFADRTSDHSLAWDAGTGNGQAALSVAEHYSQVIATDTSAPQLGKAVEHPRVKYIQTPPILSTQDLINLFGPDPESSVDLITAAMAVQWFDMPSFYATATRVLKPGGVIAVWCYSHAVVNPEFDPIMTRFEKKVLPYFHPNMKYIHDGYKNLPFPFEDVGLGKEGEPKDVDMSLGTVSFERFIGMLRSWSAVAGAKARGIDLLDDALVKEMEIAWGGSEALNDVVYKAHMLVGRAIKGKSDT